MIIEWNSATVIAMLMVASIVLIAFALFAGREEERLESAASRINQVPRPAEVIARHFRVTIPSVTHLKSWGLGFGQIAVLLSLARATEAPPEQLLRRFAAGESWAQMARSMGVDLSWVVTQIHKACGSTQE